MGDFVIGDSRYRGWAAFVLGGLLRILLYEAFGCAVIE